MTVKCDLKLIAHSWRSLPKMHIVKSQIFFFLSSSSARGEEKNPAWDINFLWSFSRRVVGQSPFSLWRPKLGNDRWLLSEVGRSDVAAKLGWPQNILNRLLGLGHLLQINCPPARMNVKVFRRWTREDFGAGVKKFRLAIHRQWEVGFSRRKIFSTVVVATRKWKFITHFEKRRRLIEKNRFYVCRREKKSGGLFNIVIGLTRSYYETVRIFEGQTLNSPTCVIV